MSPAELRRRAPRTLKVAGRRLSVLAGERTAGLRMLPSFVLAGGQRCGSTSLFRALQAHPAVLPPVHHKGVNYFDVAYDRGPAWYRGHFPVRAVAAARTRAAGEPARTFEASGYYLYHPHAAARLGADLPGVQVLVVLRDPVERAFSAYKHEKARGFETETFERALELEDERVQPELEAMLADPSRYSAVHRHQSYRRRGQYAEQLQRIVDAVGRDRLLVLQSEEFFAEPRRQYARITDFLGLRPYLPTRFDRWNARPGQGLSDLVRDRLRATYEPHDEALEALLGRPPGWRT